ncbi:MAG: hypothetical protein ACRCY4_09510 [Brevinema sp.]
MNIKMFIYVFGSFAWSLLALSLLYLYYIGNTINMFEKAVAFVFFPLLAWAIIYFVPDDN